MNRTGRLLLLTLLPALAGVARAQDSGSGTGSPGSGAPKQVVVTREDCANMKKIAQPLRKQAKATKQGGGTVDRAGTRQSIVSALESAGYSQQQIRECKRIGKGLRKGVQRGEQRAQGGSGGGQADSEPASAVPMPGAGS